MEKNCRKVAKNSLKKHM